MKLERRLIIFDIEATGTDIANDRIISLAALEVFPNAAPEAEPLRWNFLINPGRSIPPGATKVHGIKDEDVLEMGRFEHVASTLLEIFAGADLCGYNIRGFDVPILWEEFYRAGITWDLSGVRIFDAHEVFRRKETRTLADAVRKFAGRELENAHEAMADARAAWDVMRGQLGYYPDLLGISAQALHDFCNTDEFEGMKSTRVDLAGHIIRTEDGVDRYTARRVRGVPVLDDVGYGFWMLKNDFPANTKLTLDRIFTEAQERADKSAAASMSLETANER